MPKSPEIQAGIRNKLMKCCGGDEYYKTLDRRLFFTDGVKQMAESCSAYWLIDLIVSHQPAARKNAMLEECQFWRLDVHERGAEAYCCTDSPIELGNAAIRQDIEYTDFPLDSIDLWVRRNSDEDWVLMLPSEN